MNNLAEWLKGKKTYLLVVGAFIYGGGIQIGLWGHYPQLDILFAGLTAASLRAGITKASVPLLLAVAMLVQSCANVQQALPYIRSGTSLACGATLRLAVEEKDRVDMANDIFVFGSVFDRLSGGRPPTPDQLRAALAQVSPKATEFDFLVNDLIRIYVDHYDEIKGNSRLCLQVLGEMARGCDDAAGMYISPGPIPLVTPIPSLMKRYG
jgi:hypothetical protein